MNLRKIAKIDGIPQQAPKNGKFQIVRLFIDFYSYSPSILVHDISHEPYCGAMRKIGLMIENYRVSLDSVGFGLLVKKNDSTAVVF